MLEPNGDAKATDGGLGPTHSSPALAQELFETATKIHGVEVHCAFNKSKKPNKKKRLSEMVSA
jgi:hypothetical protein